MMWLKMFSSWFSWIFQVLSYHQSSYEFKKTQKFKFKIFKKNLNLNLINLNLINFNLI